MVDTAGTLCKAAEVLKQHGARRVFCFASHGVFSGPAPERIAASALTELVVLDTIPLSPQAAVSQPVSSFLPSFPLAS
jgi:ribose-phosphate pyrophosphokinase